MVELRKRPAPPSSTAPPPTKRRSSAPSKNDKYSKNNSKPKETKPKAEPLSSTESTDKSKTRVFGDKKYLDGPLGNDVVEGHGGEKMTLRELAERPDGNADIIIKKIKDGVRYYIHNNFNLHDSLYELCYTFHHHQKNLNLSH